MKLPRMQQKKGKPAWQSIDDIRRNFISIASHQLRTPTAGIRWALETALSQRLGRLNANQRSVLHDAYESTQILSKTITDLLRASRIEEQGLNIKPTFVSVQQLMREVIADQEQYSQALQCRLILKKSSNVRAYIDRDQIFGVISGVVHNAIIYGQHRSNVEIEISHANRFVTIKVIDHGIGIPRDQQQFVFLQFFRGRNAIMRHAEGLGLDLYLAKLILDASGGSITFSSIEKKGSTFALRLPMSAAVAEQHRAVPQPSTQELMRREREFVSITVHELRAPLNANRWGLEMLSRETLGPLNVKQRDLVRDMNQGNKRMLELVNDLLNLSRLQEGKFSVAIKKISLKSVFETLRAEFREVAAANLLQLTFPRNLSTNMVLADHERLTQAVANIISNAIKYTPKQGSVSVRVRQLSREQFRRLGRVSGAAGIAHVDHGRGYVIISVHDTGIGISPAEQRLIFTKFFRSQSVIGTKTEGTGLGLYIAKSIVNLHKGDIWFESVPGRGSTFYVSIPLA